MSAAAPGAVRVLVDASALLREPAGPAAPLWWGVAGLVAIESTVVASFAASVLYWRATHAPWPPPGLDLPSPWLPGLGAALLLLSCLSMWGAGRALGRDEVSRCVGLIVTSLLLASATLALRGWQFTQFGYRWDAHPWGSLLWTLSGFHFVHVVSAVIGTAVVALLGAMGYFSRRRQLAVVVDSLYWYFVAVAWLPLYAVLYGVPRWT